MTENNSTADSAIPEELAGVQSQLERMMGSVDDETKKLIFRRLLLQLVEVLPEPPPKTFAKEPEPMLASSSLNLLHASDKLCEASHLAEFVQSISLNLSHDGEINLQPRQVTGFYYAMKHVIDVIEEANALIDKARAEPEAVTA